jgi:hypothetical protein
LDGSQGIYAEQKKKKRKSKSYKVYASIYRTFLKRQTYIDGELLVVEKDYRSEEGGE